MILMRKPISSSDLSEMTTNKSGSNIFPPETSLHLSQRSVYNALEFLHIDVKMEALWLIVHDPWC